MFAKKQRQAAPNILRSFFSRGADRAGRALVLPIFPSTPGKRAGLFLASPTGLVGLVRASG